MSRSIGDSVSQTGSSGCIYGDCESVLTMRKDLDVFSNICFSQLNTVGVISTPEIIEHDITRDDRILVLASDGVWEFIGNDEAAGLFKGSLLCISRVYFGVYV